jgi:hypothetical protein
MRSKKCPLSRRTGVIIYPAYLFRQSCLEAPSRISFLGLPYALESTVIAGRTLHMYEKDGEQQCFVILLCDQPS